jgi:hypothetical protein
MEFVSRIYSDGIIVFFNILFHLAQLLSLHSVNDSKSQKPAAESVYSFQRFISAKVLTEWILFVFRYYFIMSGSSSIP